MSKCEMGGGGRVGWGLGRRKERKDELVHEEVDEVRMGVKVRVREQVEKEEGG